MARNSIVDAGSLIFVNVALGAMTKIAKNWEVYDALGLMRQIGAVSPPEQVGFSSCSSSIPYLFRHRLVSRKPAVASQRIS